MALPIFFFSTGLLSSVGIRYAGSRTFLAFEGILAIVIPSVAMGTLFVVNGRISKGILLSFLVFLHLIVALYIASISPGTMNTNDLKEIGNLSILIVSGVWIGIAIGSIVGIEKRQQARDE